MKIAQSPLSALRASSGDWLIVTLGLQEISSLLILRPEDLYSLPLEARSLVSGNVSLDIKSKECILSSFQTPLKSILAVMNNL